MGILFAGPSGKPTAVGMLPRPLSAAHQTPPPRLAIVCDDGRHLPRPFALAASEGKRVKTLAPATEDVGELDKQMEDLRAKREAQGLSFRRQPKKWERPTLGCSALS